MDKDWNQMMDGFEKKIIYISSTQTCSWRRSFNKYSIILQYETLSIYDIT